MLGRGQQGRRRLDSSAATIRRNRCPGDVLSLGVARKTIIVGDLLRLCAAAQQRRRGEAVDHGRVGVDPWGQAPNGRRV